MSRRSVRRARPRHVQPEGRRARRRRTSPWPKYGAPTRPRGQAPAARSRTRSTGRRRRGSALRRSPPPRPAAEWAGIGLSGMIPTLVRGRRGWRPVGPAFTWEDCRAARRGRGDRSRQSGEIELYQRTGQPIDGRYLLPMFAWLAGTTPSAPSRTALLLGAKDYLFSWLTGQSRPTPARPAGYGCYDLDRRTWMAAWRRSPARPLPAAGPAGRCLPAGRPRRPATRPLDRGRRAAISACRRACRCALGAADSVLAAHGARRRDCPATSPTSGARARSSWAPATDAHGRPRRAAA